MGKPAATVTVSNVLVGVLDTRVSADTVPGAVPTNAAVHVAPGSKRTADTLTAGSRATPVIVMVAAAGATSRESGEKLETEPA